MSSNSTSNAQLGGISQPITTNTTITIPGSTYASSNTIFNPGVYTFTPPHEPGYIEHVLYGNKGTCDACRVEDRNLVMGYRTKSITRQICEFCFIAAKDKIYGINSTTETLETLFKKE